VDEDNSNETAAPTRDPKP